jgi:hypothetical protein
MEHRSVFTPFRSGIPDATIFPEFSAFRTDFSMVTYPNGIHPIFEAHNLMFKKWGPFIALSSSAN